MLRLRFQGLRPGRTLRLFLKGDRFSTFPLHDWVHSRANRLFLVDDVDRPDRALRDARISDKEQFVPYEISHQCAQKE